MATYLVHDRRILGRTPTTMANGFFLTNENTPLSSMITMVSVFAAATGKIDWLYIMAHGLTEVNSKSLGRYESLGLGIEICKENLLIGNLGLLSAWKGKVSNILLLSCSIAGVTPASKRPVNPHLQEPGGEVFCKTIASTTGATVMASDTNQLYTIITRQANWKAWLGMKEDEGDIDPWSFLQMEGNVRFFRP
jgi:hypothetical protein